MTICTFFQQGRCKFGDRCKYEHPGRQQQSFSSGNRFGALSSGGSGFSSRVTSGQSQQSQQSKQSVNYGVTTDEITDDLTAGKGRPEWVFSCYGPGRNAPRQLFGGPQREQSFEELRLRHYEAAAAGNPATAVQEAENMYNEAINQMNIILKSVAEAVRYVVDGEKEHPNRIDIANGNTGPSTGSAFGQPSAPSQTPAFGSSGFSQPQSSQPAFGQTAFGQTSALGQGSGFGQPSALGQGSGFGQPSALGGSSAFGKPAFGQSGFAQQSASGLAGSAASQPAFGQASSMGASPFGQASGTASPFSQMSAPTATSGFSQPSAFSQASTGFGQPTNTPATTSGFGTPAQAPNPFGQPAVSQPAAAPNPFGAPAPNPTPAAFGQPAAAPSQLPQPASAPSQPASTGPPPLVKIENTNDLQPIPPLNGQTQRDPMSRKLTRWKGQPVQYINDAPCYLHPQDMKTYVRIFFPDGPPDKAGLRDAEAEPEKYTPEVAAQYEFFVQNGVFKDGLIPSVPPKTEWVSFDF